LLEDALLFANTDRFANEVQWNRHFDLLALHETLKISVHEPAVDALFLRVVARHWRLHRIDALLDWLLPEVAAAVERLDRADRRGQLTDPTYNMTLGSSYLANLIDSFSGSYVLAIASYNAGDFNVRDWMGDWGDPRSASTDVVDWIELIPFSETRNYVQRVIENLAVYRVRFDSSTTVATKNEQRVVTKETNAAPTPAATTAQ